MKISASKKLKRLEGYAFDEVDKIVKKLEDKGVDPIDFGVGDPLDPTPEFIREAVKEGLDKHANAGYPSYIGSTDYRKAASEWMKKRFGVELNPKTEITSTIGSKEAIFNFPEAIINPGETVIVPSPGYPPMKNGTIFAEGNLYFTPLLEKNNFLIDFKSIPEKVADKARMIWINYPNSPTGKVAPLDYYENLIEWARNNNIIIAADEGCYIDIYFDKKPHSILEIEKEGIICFYSLSKRSNMTGYRTGFVAGDERLVEIFKKLKTNIDSGTPRFIQDGAIAALKDESHAEEMREKYKTRRDLMLDALKHAGLETRNPEATFYIWQKTPKGMSSVKFSKLLLEPEIAVVTTPGSWISYECENNINPGEGYVRFALVPTTDRCEKAAEKIKNNLKI